MLTACLEEHYKKNKNWLQSGFSGKATFNTGLECLKRCPKILGRKDILHKGIKNRKEANVATQRGRGGRVKVHWAVCL